MASGRISYTFGLRGSALTVDTACSSSLTSMHMAYNSLLLGQCSKAINTGINIMLSIETPAAFGKSGMLAADGRCKVLDAAADGYVRAEAAGAMVLETMPAINLLDRPALGIIAGSAINQDGRSSSLTAPNGPAQQDVIRTALAAAGAD